MSEGRQWKYVWPHAVFKKLTRIPTSLSVTTVTPNYTSNAETEYGETKMLPNSYLLFLLPLS